MVEQCTLKKALNMVIPPQGIVIPCPVHTGGHFIRGMQPVWKAKPIH